MPVVGNIAFIKVTILLQKIKLDIYTMNSTQLNSKMFICNMQEHTYNHIGSLKPMTGLFDSTYI